MKKNIYLSYSLSFIIILLIGMLPLEIYNRKIFGVGLFTDGLKQHLPFMKDYVLAIKRAIINQESLQIYRYNLGLGNDFLLNYTYYSLFDPLTIIAYFIPITYIEISYYLLIVIRLYLAGLLMIILARKLGINNFFALLATSIFYTFNITIIYSAFRHPMFINGPMLLPLIIFGVEKILNRESPYIFIITCFYGLISQFYFFVYLVFGFELYLIIRLFEKKEYKSIITFFKVNLFFLLGVCLGGFVLLPQLIAVLNSSRINSKGIAFYNFQNYAELIGSFMVPIVGKYYSSGIGNIFVLLIVLSYIIANKCCTWDSKYFIITSGLMFLPIFSYCLNLFSYVNNRWSFLISLPAATIIGKAIESKKINIESVKKALKIIIFFILLSCLLLLLHHHLIFGFVIIIVLLLAINKIFRKINIYHRIKELFDIKKLSKITLITSFIVLFITSIFYLFATTNEGLEAYSNPHAFAKIIEDQSFFRVEQNKFVLNTDNFGNDNLQYHFNSTYTYNTMASKEINQVIRFFNVINNNRAGYNGFNSRNGLNTINNVKYIIIRESENKKIPYGFELYDTIYLEKFVSDKFNYGGLGYIEYENGKRKYEKAYIYRNKNFLSFGTVYYKYVTIDEAKKLSYLERENLLLEAVILEKSNERIERLLVDNNNTCLTIDNYQTENLFIDDEFIIVLGEEGRIKFSLNHIKNSELFLEIKGLKHHNKYQDFAIIFKANDYQNKINYYRYGSSLYVPQKDYFINLGYYDEEGVDIEVIFPRGKYHYEKIYYYLNPMDDVALKIAALNQNTLSNLQFNDRGFSGRVQIENDGFLFIALPFSNGFKAYVNGEEVKIERANCGYMGINLPSGENYIEFVYHTPGLFWGINISLIAIIIILFIIWNDINKKYKIKKDF